VSPNRAAESRNGWRTLSISISNITERWIKRKISIKA
jgi:hypothetical protein